MQLYFPNKALIVAKKEYSKASIPFLFIVGIVIILTPLYSLIFLVFIFLSATLFPFLL